MKMNRLEHRHLYTFVFLITSHILNLTGYFFILPSRYDEKNASGSQEGIEIAKLLLGVQPLM